MKMIKKILFWILSTPFLLVTSIRNFLYNIGVIKSHQFNIPIISIGNLDLGGAGKTPSIEYLVRLRTNTSAPEKLRQRELLNISHR